MDTMDECRIGLFWFVGDNFDELIGLSRPVGEVPLLGGFKTVDDGHDAVWRRLFSSRPDLAGFGYEFFPRGRVNWSEADGFILLADKLILDAGLQAEVLAAWRLPEDSLVMTDPHYRRHSLTTLFRERGRP